PANLALVADRAIGDAIADYGRVRADATRADHPCERRNRRSLADEDRPRCRVEYHVGFDRRAALYGHLMRPQDSGWLGYRIGAGSDDGNVFDQLRRQLSDEVPDRRDPASAEAGDA